MRPTLPQFDTQAARTDGAAFRPIVFIYPPNQPSRAFSTDRLYDPDIVPELLSLGDIAEAVGQLGDVTLEVLDTPENRAVVQLAAMVKIYLYPVDTGSMMYMATLFHGVISDPIDMTGGKIRFDVVSYATRHDRVIGDPITMANYPGADPDVIGHIMPILYGVHQDHPCLAIDAGSMSPLRLNLTASATTLALSDASAFPSAGTVQVDGEEITFTGNANNDLTGCTRGANGTTAVAHDKGAVVAELQTQYDYLVAGHPVKDITNIKADDVLQIGTDYTVLPNDGGVAKIRFNTLPSIQKSTDIEVNDGIAVNDGVGVYDDIFSSTTSKTTVTHNTTSVVGEGQTVTRNYGDTTTIYSNFPAEIGGFTTYSCSMLLINALRIAVKVNNGNWLYILGTASTNGPPSNGVLTVNLTSTLPENQVTWYIFWDSNVTTWQRQTHTRTITGVLIPISKSGSAKKSGAVTKSGTVTLTGNSVAETVIGKVITCDVEGFEDDAAGSIAGAPNALIEQPEHVARHLLRYYGQATDAETPSGDFDAFTGDRLAIRITRPRRVRELLDDIAEQAGGLAHFSAGSWAGRWRFIKRTNPFRTPDITLDDTHIIRLDSGASSIAESFVGLRKLRNRHIWRAGLRPDGGWSAAGQVDDANSQADYGLRDVNVDLPFVPSQTQALLLMGWRSTREANPNRKVIALDATLAAFKVQPGDIVQIASTKTGASIIGETIAAQYAGQGRMRLTIEDLGVSGQSIVWTDMVDVIADNGGLLSTGGVGWGHGAASVQGGAGHVAVEFTVVTPSHTIGFGLSISKSDYTANSIDYCIFTGSDANVKVYENGAYLGVFGAAQIGDVLRVERIGGTVFYKRNGAVIFTSSTPSSGTLIADTSIFGAGVRLDATTIFI